MADSSRRNTIIIGCHTASALAKKRLKKELTAKVVMTIEPSVKAVMVWKPDVLGIIGTVNLVESGVYPDLIRKLKKNTKVKQLACPTLASCVESGGEPDEMTTKQILTLKDCDTLLLACTHYPELTGWLRKLLPKVRIVDPSWAIANEALWLEKYNIKGGVEFNFTKRLTHLVYENANIIKI